MEWGTFYGRSVDSSQLSHQHLSNIIWYFRVLLNSEPHTQIFIELNTRFGGIQLPYKPMHSFNWEIDKLFSKGYIANKHDSDVFVNGQWIGRLEYS